MVHEAFTSGGGRARSARYLADGTLGEFAGVANHSASGFMNFTGFPGQITEEPVGFSASYEVSRGGAAPITLTGADPENEVLAYRVVASPAQGTLTGTPPNLTYQAGPSFATSDQFTFAVRDGTFESVPAMITLSAVEANAPPSITLIPDQWVSEGQLLSIQAAASDPNQPRQSLAFSLVPGSPSGAAIDAATGLFTWVPAEADGPGAYDITLQVTDDGSPPLQAATSFRVTVLESNQAPSLAPIADYSVVAGASLSIASFASDGDQPSQLLSYTLGPGAPDGARIEPLAGLFTWTPRFELAGHSFLITVIATDDGAPPLSSTRAFTVTVTAPPPPANTAPRLAAIDDVIARPSQTITFTARATDADVPAQQLFFSLGSGAPDTARIDSASGLFSWTVPASQWPGDVRMTVIVTDSGSPPASSSQSFAVQVTAWNTPPSLGSVPDQVLWEGTTLRFTLLAEDADMPRQKLSGSLEPGAPDGAQLDPNSLEFSWTPSEAQGPGDYSIAVRVTDDGDPPLSAVASFHVAVLELNSAPILDPIPEQSVVAGQTLEFTARASDPDLPAQMLTFSIAQAVQGARIDPVTGHFSWAVPESHPAGQVTLNLTVRDDALPASSASQPVRIHVSAKPPVLSPTIHAQREGYDQLKLTVTGTPGACFRVETATDLQDWTVLNTGVADENGRFSFSERLESGSTSHFYRALGVACETLRQPEWLGAFFPAASEEARFSLHGIPNACYAIEATADFRTWTPLTVLKADADGNLVFVTPVSAARMMFRAREGTCP